MYPNGLADRGFASAEAKEFDDSVNVGLLAEGVMIEFLKTINFIPRSLGVN
jgi:hypothetical protein